MHELTFIIAGVVGVWLLLKITDSIWNLLKWLLKLLVRVIVVLILLSFIFGSDVVLTVLNDVIDFFSSIFENQQVYENNSRII